MATAPSLFSIPSEGAFVDALAAGVLERYGADPLGLARTRILLPTRRGTRALQDAFLRASNGKPMILPRIQAIGDPDEDEIILESLGGEAAGDYSLPPAIPPLHRQILLSKLVLQWQEVGGITDPAGAFYLAGELGRLLDQVQTERISFTSFRDLVPEDFAAHWQKTLKFLEIVTAHWPHVLRERGFIDPAERRNQLLYGLSELWSESPPAGPVIAAGSTGSMPATAELLKTIAWMPEGLVVLPGLDDELDDESWQLTSPTHPQHGMRLLLDHIGARRDQVQPWAYGASPPSQLTTRRRLINESLRPAATTAAWMDYEEDTTGALKDLVRIDAPTLQDEATAIALIMREILETPGKTAGLVTADRRLARRVSAQLRRWDIDVDDSAGQPLSEHAVGTFMRLTAALISEDAAPIPLLSLLKHPLCTAGMDRAALRRLTASLERKVLRGPRPSPGFSGLKDALKDVRGGESLTGFVTRLGKLAGPLVRLVGRNHAPLETLIEAHIDVCEALAETEDEEGAIRLWSGEAGEAMATFLEDLKQAAADAAPIPGASYEGLFEAALSGQVVRPRWATHPRLNIWGPLEARMQQADIMILGGLNEGVWPPDPGADPWMSRPMRAQLGLPLPERRIGLSAHDFAQAACAPKVYLTRAQRVDGTPTLPARWLLRLEALGNVEDTQKSPYTAWASMLDRPHDVQPVDAPAPTPPISARPRALSVTEIELWMRDPYGLYAKRILGLRPFDEIDADPAAREYGTFIHEALEVFIKRHKANLPEDGLAELISLGEQTFSPFLHRPTVRAFWWPRFAQIAAWFLAEQQSRAGTATPVEAETSGTLNLPVDGGFALRAKADRIDALAGGGYEIIDYKTGGTPRMRQIAAGYAPQLPLEAAMAQAGAFDGVDPGEVLELAYWSLKGGLTGSSISPVSRMLGAPPIAELAQEALDGLARLVTAFDRAETPYRSHPNPVERGWGDYDHLARVKEWGQ